MCEYLSHEDVYISRMLDCFFFIFFIFFILFFFFQAEDGIRDAQESRGLGDVYKRQVYQAHPS